MICSRHTSLGIFWIPFANVKQSEDNQLSFAIFLVKNLLFRHWVAANLVLILAGCSKCSVCLAHTCLLEYSTWETNSMVILSLIDALLSHPPHWHDGWFNIPHSPRKQTSWGSVKSSHALGMGSRLGDTLSILSRLSRMQSLEAQSD